MKRITFLLPLLLLAITQITSAQTMIPISPRKVNVSDQLDNEVYKVTYDLSFVSDPSDPKFITEDVITLQIGKQMQKEYSESYYQADVAAQEALESGRFPKLMVNPLTVYVLYKNWPNNGDVTVDYRLPMKAPVMTFKDKMPTINWTMTNEVKEIIGYRCQKATTELGGRMWTVWFTQEIPVNAGPYLLEGLPGLILEAKDDEGHYHYTCTSFTKSESNSEIGRWEWDQQEITKDKMKVLLKELYANPEQTAKALGASVHFGGDAMLNLPYNPIDITWK